MNRTEFTNADLKKAAHLVALSYADSLPSAEDCKHEFSSNFKAKMEPIIKKAVSRERRRSALKGTAAIFILIFISLTVWLSFDAEARGKVLEWVREVWENGIVYRFDTDSNSTEVLPEYVITWIPDGFELVDEYEDETMYSAIYENKDMNLGFICDYRIVVGETKSQFVFEEDTKSEFVSINGIIGEYFYDEEANDLIWIDAEKGIEFGINGNISKEDIIKIAESVKYS